MSLFLSSALLINLSSIKYANLGTTESRTRGSRVRSAGCLTVLLEMALLCQDQDLKNIIAALLRLTRMFGMAMAGGGGRFGFSFFDSSEASVVEVDVGVGRLRFESPPAEKTPIFIRSFRPWNVNLFMHVSSQSGFEPCLIHQCPPIS